MGQGGGQLSNDYGDYLWGALELAFHFGQEEKEDLLVHLLLPHLSVMPEEGVSVVVRGLSYWPKKKLKNQIQPLIDDINFVATSGRLVGILGPSGGGKTTLLNAIGGRLRSGLLQGSVEFIRAKLPEENYSRSLDEFPPSNDPWRVSNAQVVSYVMAQDRFLPGLTVKETLQYAAQLKFPQLTSDEREQKIQKVMKDVKLNDISETVIRFGSHLPFGDSKRLSLAVELLDQSPVLLLDEPTTGLDNSIATNIISGLHQVARDNNTTVICSIHQPRTSVFNMFDDIVLLSKGRLVYFGPPRALAHYFEGELGFRCPSLWSPADFALEIVSNSTSLEQEKSEQSISTDPVVIETPTKKVLQSFRPCSQHIPVDALAELYSRSQWGKTQRMQVQSICDDANKVVLCPNGRKILSTRGWLDQTWVLIKRQFRSQTRDMLAFWLLLLINILQGIVIGSIFWQMPDHAKNYHPVQLNTSLFSGGYVKHHPILKLFDYIEDGRPILETLLFNDTLLSHTDDLISILHRELNLPVPEHPLFNILNEIVGNAMTISGHTTASTELKPVSAVHNINPSYFSKWVTLGFKSFQVFNHIYNKYFGNILGCNVLVDTDPSKEGPAAEFYTCVGVRSYEIARIFLMDFMGFGDPIFLIKTIAADCKKYNCYSWINENDVPVDKRMLSEFSVRDNLTWGYFMNLTDEKVLEISDKWGMTPWMTQNIGTEPLLLIRPIQNFVRILSDCTHFSCNYLKSGKQLFSSIAKELMEFVEASYRTLGTMFNLSGVLFFLSLFLGLCAYDILLTFPKTRLLFNKETASGLYYPLPYYVAKTIVDAPFQLVASLTLAIILYFMTGFHSMGVDGFSQFSTYCCICVLTSFAAYGFGYMVSAASSRLEFALIVAPIFLMVWLSTAGFFLRDSDLPSWIAWFKYAGFYRWGFFAHTMNIFRSGNFFGNMPNEINLAFCGISRTSIAFCCSMLITSSIVYRILGFIFLKYFHRNIGLES